MFAESPLHGFAEQYGQVDFSTVISGDASTEITEEVEDSTTTITEIINAVNALNTLGILRNYMVISSSTQHDKI